VYWGVIILITVTLRQKKVRKTSKAHLMRLFGVSGKTISRWIAYFREDFPFSRHWKNIRGRICSSVKDSELPGSLLHFFNIHRGAGGKALVECLRFLSCGAVAGK